MTPPLHGELTAVAFSDSTHGIVTTNRGRIATTSDGGISWKITLLDSNTFLGGVYWQSPRWRVIGSGGGIWTSWDDGASWKRSDSVTSLFVASAAFIKESGGIAVGNNGLILREKDQPGSWKSVRRGMDRHVDGMAVLSPTSWLSFGYPGAILKTNDAGTTDRTRESPRFDPLSGGVVPRQARLAFRLRWDHRGFRGRGNQLAGSGYSRKGLRLFGIAWRDSLIAVAVGESAALWRTVDAGRTWTETPHPPGVDSQTLSAVSFRSDGAGFIAGYKGLILRSLDQGATWTVIPTPVLEPLYAFSFRDASVGLAVGGHGVVLTTKDGGASWTHGSPGAVGRQHLRHRLAPRGYGPEASGNGRTGGFSP